MNQIGKYIAGIALLLTLITTGCLPANQAKKGAGQPAPELPSLEGRKVLLTYGGWGGHMPKVITDTLANWLQEQGATIIVTDSLNIYTDTILMNSLDLIIQNVTMGSISRLETKGLLNAIRHGVGLAGCHGGIGDSYRENPDYQFVVGGQWVAHPGGEVDYRVNITHDQDPITAGLQDFDIHSEQYYMHVDPNIQVLATTTYSGEHGDWFAGAVMPVTWKKYYGKGRIFYTSLGHKRADFDIPQAWEMMTRGIRWASAGKYAPKEDWVEAVYPKTRK